LLSPCLIAVHVASNSGFFQPTQARQVEGQQSQPGFGQTASPSFDDLLQRHPPATGEVRCLLKEKYNALLKEITHKEKERGKAGLDRSTERELTYEINDLKNKLDALKGKAGCPRERGKAADKIRKELCRAIIAERNDGSLAAGQRSSASTRGRQLEPLQYRLAPGIIIPQSLPGFDGTASPMLPRAPIPPSDPSVEEDAAFGALTAGPVSLGWFFAKCLGPGRPAC
jgi:hypothetical protein